MLQANDPAECSGHLHPAPDKPQCSISLTRTVCFYSPPLDGSQPKSIILDMAKDGARNYPHHKAEITIRDIRGREGEFVLGIHGFQVVVDMEMAALRLSTPGEIETTYVPKIKDLLLKHVEGSRKMIVFDTTIRRAAKSCIDLYVRYILIGLLGVPIFGRDRVYQQTRQAASIQENYDSAL